MLCESCHQNEATIHLTQVVEGKVKKLHICESCAKESGMDVEAPVSITDLLLGMGDKDLELPVSDTEKTCPRCHQRRSEFKKLGRLGCEECYQAFESELLPLIKAMHRSDRHVGKVPSRESVRVKVSAEVATLKQQIDKAIATENYEEAASLRDQIQKCLDLVEQEQKKASGSGEKPAKKKGGSPP